LEMVSWALRCFLGWGLGNDGEHGKKL
jgi:hypothetical protein